MLVVRLSPMPVMMSIPQLGSNVPSAPTQRDAPLDWGRGDRLQVQHQKVDRPAPFHYGLQPMASEMYDVTNLRRSENRPNDQLLPKPTEFPIGHLQPRYKIPSEHPYASHIERTALFPEPSTTLVKSNSVSFIDTENRERAAATGGEDPAAPYDVTGVEKARGLHSYRREVVNSAIPASAMQPKSFADPYANSYSVNRLNQATGSTYPTPPSYVNPNTPLNRDNQLGVSPRTGAAALNSYRGDRMTSSALQYTGNGPADTLKVDQPSAVQPESLKQFIPPRPLAGRATTVGPLSRVRPIYCKAPNGEQFCDCWYCCEERAFREHRFSVQQIDAGNRLSQLNLQTPKDNIVELRRKYAAAGVPKYGYSPASQYAPQIFYNQMGKYLSERSGLYRPISYSIDAAGMGSQLYQQTPMQFYVKEPPVGGSSGNAENNPFLKEAQAVQDGKRIHTDTDYGANYNTPTFLQENALKISAQNDKTSLMSANNEDLRRVASMSSIPLARESDNPLERRGFNNPVTSAYLGGAVGGQLACWRPNCGVPWPHFNMSVFQNSFSRSAVHRDFHSRFPERAPDLRENVYTGKRHDFDGMNAQEIRGSATAR